MASQAAPGPNGVRSVPPPVSSLVGPLLTDMYQLTMAYAYWDAGRHERPAVFDLFFRANPFDGTFTVFGGLDECIQLLAHYRFSADEIAYVRTVLPNAREEFFTEFLPSVDCSQVRVFAQADGSVVLPFVPLMRLEGPLAVAQLLETTLLNLVNYASLVATNAARHRIAAGDDALLVEFGARRAHGPDGALHASKYCYLGGFDATSNLLAGQLYGIPVRGTHAHSFVQSFSGLEDLAESPLRVQSTSTRTTLSPTEFLDLCLKIRKEIIGPEGKAVDAELAAFASYAMSFPASFLALVDTYDTLRSGVPNFVAVALALHQLGYSPVGIRLDSGDLVALSIQARNLFSLYAQKYSTALPTAPAMAKKLIIMASNSLNVDKLLELKHAQHAVRAFGIGTELVTCWEQPALGCVYKLAELNGRPRMKLSEDAVKMTIPGSKKAYRIFVADYSSLGELVVDLLSTSSEAAPCQGEPVTYIDLAQFENDMRTHERKSSTRTIVPARVESRLLERWPGSVGTGRESPLYGTNEYLTKARERCKDELQALGYATSKTRAHAGGMSLTLAKLARSVMASFHKET